MLHKQRMAMGKRDERYEMHGMVELDEGFFAATIDRKVNDNINPDSTILSDNFTSYVHFKDIVATHIPKVIPKEDIGKVLP